MLRRLAEELATAPGPIVVLHGAGSFGHPGARQFGLAAPPAADDRAGRRARGASIVAAEVRRLHLAVLRDLVAAGVSAASVPPATLAANRAGILEAFDAAPFRDALAGGRVPVAFGDVVPDRAWGWSILSADTIAVRLASELPVSRAIFVSDVPGLLAPRTAGPLRVVPELDETLWERLRPAPGAPDVTGGIRGKVSAMLALARSGVDAALISGLTDGELSRAVRGESVYGSWAHARPPDASGRGGDRP
ncbi:aspartate/glutamate/uridylate kinase [mine drainage metagenome]|uniref:Isopentenyl phosphate kinase n=1 Tax=mine drainage metagenome TaxID=410659 RepID=T0YZW6_9ZZZZ